MDKVTAHQLITLCAILSGTLIACLAWISWLHANRRSMRRSQKELKRSLRNLRTRDEGAPLSLHISKP